MDEANVAEHPVRGAILRQLRGGEAASPARVAEVVGVPLSNAAYHLDVLEQAEAVEVADTRHTDGAVIRSFRATPKGELLIA